MDVMLLKRYDKAQDIDALYREILRNCNEQRWYWPGYTWQCIGCLNINQSFKKDYIQCVTNDDEWIVEKWLNLT